MFIATMPSLMEWSAFDARRLGLDGPLLGGVVGPSLVCYPRPLPKERLLDCTVRVLGDGHIPRPTGTVNRHTTGSWKDGLVGGARCGSTLAPRGCSISVPRLQRVDMLPACAVFHWGCHGSTLGFLLTGGPDGFAYFRKALGDCTATRSRTGLIRPPKRKARPCPCLLTSG